MSALVINKDGKENEKGKNPLAANEEIEYVDYEDERMLDDIQILVSKDLSEPYSVFTYRYFVHNWPNLSICVYAKNKETNERKMIGTIVCKADTEFGYMAGYIAMLTVDKEYRHFGIGSKLVNMGLERMVEMGCLEIILETEVTNEAALRLYARLGFVKEEKMSKYYLNGSDAFRLKLYIDLTKITALAEQKRQEEEKEEAQQKLLVEDIPQNNNNNSAHKDKPKHKKDKKKKK